MKRDTLLGLRDESDFLSALGEREFDALCGAMTKVTYAAGKAKSRPTNPGRVVGFVVEGVVALTRTSRVGRTVVLGELRAGGAYGLMEVLRPDPSTLQVQVYRDTTVAEISHQRFLELMLSYPALRSAAAVYVADYAAELAQRLFERDALRSESRIHAELLRLARDNGVSENRAAITPPPTDTTLAYLTGTNRSVVNRTLSALGRAGVVRKQLECWELRDVEALEGMVRSYSDRYTRRSHVPSNASKSA